MWYILANSFQSLHILWESQTFIRPKAVQWNVYHSPESSISVEFQTDGYHFLETLARDTKFLQGNRQWQRLADDDDVQNSPFGDFLPC
jgi:hypothetical protein